MGLFYIWMFLVWGIVLYTLARGIAEWARNNRSPELSVWAKLVGKRTHVTHHTYNHSGHMHMTHSRSYYLTFERESGERMEFRVSSRVYALHAEGDTGTLSFQGTRFLDFVRG